MFSPHYDNKNQEPLKWKNVSRIENKLETLLDSSETVAIEKNMSKIMILSALLLLTSPALSHGDNSEHSNARPTASIQEVLESLRAKHKLPGLAVAVIVDGKIVSTNVAGLRKEGGVEKVMLDDKFHLGSITKSMTATLAAMLEEEGKITWKTTIADLFPELKAKTHSDYLGVTLEQLLAQRGGAPGHPPPDLWKQAWAAKGSAAEQRLSFIKGILARPPEAKPGTKYIYSNQGYTIAGVMLERASGKTWEDLMQTRLFKPLRMMTAGFGTPAAVGQINQPWGHTADASGANLPVPPGPEADNPLAISPAGAVHCSIGDLARYAVFHLAGERGEGKLLKPDSFHKLHTAVGDDYALGWMVLERDWAHGKALTHNGSNTTFYAVVWIAPERNFAVVVATNVGSDSAFGACDDVVSAMIHRFLTK
jgi:CubicO group peptidase (beta-lactamase class C family)